MVARLKFDQKPQDKITVIITINTAARRTTLANPTIGTEIRVGIAVTMVSQTEEIAEIAMIDHTVIINLDQTNATIHAVIIGAIEEVMDVITTNDVILIDPTKGATTGVEILATGILEMAKGIRKSSPIMTGFVKSVTM
ncbi:MAG TPA: hypothetical protein D7H81_03840 [Candidatus Poseidoniales archaeon]|nr:MAG TPA: hypothetical protein D7H81_03840 [Candidatus Poseidoniales archaeon]